MERASKFILFAGVSGVLLLALPAYTTAPVEEQRWNTDEDRQRCNNCYNYATNHPNGSFAQPGWASGGSMSSPYTCGGVLSAAESDGLTFAGHSMDEARSRCPADCCLVALVNSGEDYHWYREDADGTWSHKRGNTPAIRHDGMGNPITDPSTASHVYDNGTRNYDMFCGFMCVCQDDLMSLRGRKPPQPIPANWYGGCPEPGCHSTPRVLDFPGCLPSGAPSLSPCVCCSCVLRITNPAGGGECR